MIDLKKLLTNMETYRSKLLAPHDPQFQLTDDDRLLHLLMLSYEMPTYQLTPHTDQDNLVILPNFSFYLTNRYNTDDIGIIYTEVFYPAAINPHAFIPKLYLLQGKQWLIDCGIAEGFFSFYAAYHGVQTIIGVEPVREFASGLVSSFAEFYRETNFQVIEAGISDQHKDIELYVDIDRLCCSSSSIVPAHNEKRVVSCATIDDIVKQNQLQQAGVGAGIIKMDIEGAEMEALHGAVQTLRDHKPLLTLAVYHDYENALLCKDIILAANPSYQVFFRGANFSYERERPYMLIAY